MKIRYLTLLMILAGSIAMSSCDKEDLFEQPSIEITGYTLLEAPGEFTYLELDLILTNNDSREVHLAEIEYQVVMEGISSELEESDIDKDFLVDTPLELTLPLTLATNDAVQLLTKLDAEEEIDYTVTGTFHVDDPILKRFTFPISIQGTDYVEVGFEDFYEQPEVTVDEITGGYSLNGITSYRFDLNVACTVLNMDDRDVVIDEVEYIVYVEGIPSETHLYSDAYAENFVLAGDESKELNLPLILNLGLTDGAALALAVQDQLADYVIEGNFHAIEVEGSAADFLLPLYVTGSVPISTIGK